MVDKSPSDTPQDVVDWNVYFARTENRPPRRTLMHALDAFAAEDGPDERRALDLGCGSGRDTLEILRRGWRVVAIDRQPDALTRLVARTPPEMAARLETRAASLQDVALPSADLVNASFVLFTLAPDDFGRVWRRMRAALRPGGRLACQLLGPRDSWVAAGRVMGHDRGTVLELSVGLGVELLLEEENDGETPRGGRKHWHVWHVVARRAGADR